MPEPRWQKSTYSQEASACLYVATTAPAGTILLRESDTPDTVLTTGPRQLHALITALRQPEAHNLSMSRFSIAAFATSRPRSVKSPLPG
ncbi:DUF397 domain-containing protein [Streptomyces sp. NPDC006365]|uniref:DUF397 domain-containing protein n=1 Tax=Streptomyces sp. NPDC006365 TaxID=3364744 RepID=UPI0036A31D7F